MIHNQDGRLDMTDLWRSLCREAQIRVNEKFPDKNVQFNPKMLYFCNEIAYRMRHLFTFYINDPKAQEILDVIIMDTLEELLSLPADVAAYGSAESSERSGVLGYKVYSPPKDQV